LSTIRGRDAISVVAIGIVALPRSSAFSRAIRLDLSDRVRARRRDRSRKK
jgi:hypothetical protein